jgi:hypothetical protein
MFLYLAMLCRLVAVLEINTQSRYMMTFLRDFFYGCATKRQNLGKILLFESFVAFLMICAPKTNPFDGNCHRRVPWAATITVAFECDFALSF